MKARPFGHIRWCPPAAVRRFIGSDTSVFWCPMSDIAWTVKFALGNIFRLSDIRRIHFFNPIARESLCPLGIGHQRTIHRTVLSQHASECPPDSLLSAPEDRQKALRIERTDELGISGLSYLSLSVFIASIFLRVVSSTRRIESPISATTDGGFPPTIRWSASICFKSSGSTVLECKPLNFRNPRRCCTCKRLQTVGARPFGRLL